MKIDIPDDERRLTVFRGRELKMFTKGDYLYTKTVSCNYCGECCLSDAPFPDDEGKCRHLARHGDVWECSAGNQVPFDCVQYDPSDKEYCCIEHTKARIK